MKSLLVSLYALNCTAAMSLRAELETKESEGLTNNTQLFPLTSKGFAPAFDLLLGVGADRGIPFTMSWLCFFYLLQIIYCCWVVYFSWVFVAVHTQITLAFHFTLLRQTPEVLPSVWGSVMDGVEQKSFIQSPSSLPRGLSSPAELHSWLWSQKSDWFSLQPVTSPAWNEYHVSHSSKISLLADFSFILMLVSDMWSVLPRLLFHLWLNL